MRLKAITFCFWLAWLFVSGSSSSLFADVNGDPLGIGRSFRHMSDIKKIYPNAGEWVLHTFNGVKFVFCEDILPSYGVSRIDMHGWFYDLNGKAWKPLVTFSIRGVGGVGIIFNDERGTCSSRGTANNKFKDKDLAIIDLNATEL
jgi:hypothetical protein